MPKEILEKPARKLRQLVAELQTVKVLETRETTHLGRRVILMHVPCADCPTTFWRPAPALRATEGHKDPIRCDKCRQIQRRKSNGKNKGKAKALTPLDQVIARIRELSPDTQRAIEKLFREHVRAVTKYDGKYDIRNAAIFLVDAIELVRVEGLTTEIPPLSAMKSCTDGVFQQFRQYQSPRDPHFT